jgi:hypothetical protein
MCARRTYTLRLRQPRYFPLANPKRRIHRRRIRLLNPRLADHIDRESPSLLDIPQRVLLSIRPVQDRDGQKRRVVGDLIEPTEGRKIADAVP